MLYKRERHPVLADFIEWVNQQPRDREYHFFYSWLCPVGLFFMETTGEHIPMHKHELWSMTHAGFWDASEEDRATITARHRDLADSNTFGELADRMNAGDHWYLY